MDYTFGGDEGDYTPSPGERTLLADFGHGLLSEIHDAISTATLHLASVPTPAALTRVDLVGVGRTASGGLVVTVEVEGAERCVELPAGDALFLLDLLTRLRPGFQAALERSKS